MTETAKITFIIPSIGRETLHTTIESLLNQTCSEWKAIVVFDGVEPCLRTTDDRFTALQIQKEENRYENRSGYVRNYGIQFATTEWVAFVDDDDTLLSEYVERFLEETDAFDNDVVIFRMVKYDYAHVPERLKYEILEHIETNNLREKSGLETQPFKYSIIEGDTFATIRLIHIYPFETTDNLYDSQVGISFAAKRYIFQSGIQFKTEQHEDFKLLDQIRSNKYKMMISPHIVYIIRDTLRPSEYNANRVFINH